MRETGRPNIEFVGGAYRHAEEAEDFVIAKLNRQLKILRIYDLKFFKKEKQTDIDIEFKRLIGDCWKNVWFIDVHECQLGPPTGGRWPWPVHLPHGVENEINPFRYKNHFENMANFSIMLVDIRKHRRWSQSDMVLVTKEVVSICETKEIKTHAPGHNRDEPMYMVPYDKLEPTWGAEKSVKWILAKINYSDI